MKRLTLALVLLGCGGADSWCRDDGRRIAVHESCAYVDETCKPGPGGSEPDWICQLVMSCNGQDVLRPHFCFVR